MGVMTKYDIPVEPISLNSPEELIYEAGCACKRGAYKDAEKLLLAAERIENKDPGKVYCALATLYGSFMCRPAGELGYILLASHSGEKISQVQLNSCRKRARNMELDTVENPGDLYILGKALLLVGDRSYDSIAEYFLDLAAGSHTNTVVAGLAAMTLYDHYLEHWYESPENRRRMARYEALAAELGNPVIL